MKNKRGILGENVIFIVLNIIFVVIVLAFLVRASNEAALKEQVYAKKIALFVDSMEPGTNVTLDVSDISGFIRENRLGAQWLTADFNENKIIIKLSSGKGYSFKSFTPLKSGMFNFNENENKLTILV